MLNIFGLAVSLAVAMLLITYARGELSFDDQFTQRPNIYRVLMQANAEYNHEKWATLPNAVGPAMLSDIPEVKAFARLVRLDFTGLGSVRAGENSFFEKNIFLTDSSFFDMFDVRFTEGNSRTAFSSPKSVVISTNKKNKMFGSEPALNKKLIINQRDTLTISGVFQDLPENSSFEGDIFLNMMDSWMGKDLYWSNASYYTFCLLNDRSNIADVEKKATALIETYIPESDRYYTRFFLQPLSEIHLHSQDVRDWMTARKGDISTVRTVFVLSMLIVLIACINYMNLATARSQKNAKEVGVNKVLGAQRNQIRLRFYLETAIISAFALVLGIAFAALSLSLFNSVMETALQIRHLLRLENMVLASIMWLTITFVGGSYPAFMMSKIPSLSLMKNIVSQSQIALYLRKGLVVFQFSCSIILIIGVIIISLQMRHVSEKDLGYQPTNIITIPMKSINTTDKYNAIKQSIESLAGTESSATVQTFPGFGESGKNIRRQGEAREGLPVRTSSSRGAVVPTLRLHLLAGTDLPDNLSADDSTCYVLINEVVSSYLGYQNPADAVGQQIQTEMSSHSVISGVVRNFNFDSLKEPIGGYVYYRMHSPNESYRYFLIRYNTSNVSTYIERLKQLFSQQLPDAAFDYQFLDEHIKSYYTAENRTNKIITRFALLTIFIACLGLFGLAAFTAEQRKKEIGVRKVLGANLFKIVSLLSSHFLGLVLIAFLISAPIAWWLFNLWLADFNDKIAIPWWTFLLAGISAVGIAMATVGYQAVKAALANPVDSLRDE